MIKSCPRCKTQKDISEFGKHKKRMYQPWCKTCQVEYGRHRPDVLVPKVAEAKCSRCGEVKPASHFYTNRRGHNGLGAYCRICHRAYFASRPKINAERTKQYRAEKRSYVQAEKVRRGCAECGECHPACLEFHHLDAAEKSDNLAKMVDSQRPYAVLDAEMAKCEVLCSNCHRKMHWNERQQTKPAIELMA